MYLENPIVPPVSRPTPSPRRTQELTTCRRILVALSFSDSTGRGWELGKCRGMGCVRSRTKNTFFFFLLKSSKTLLIYFYEKLCAQCGAMDKAPS